MRSLDNVLGARDLRHEHEMPTEINLGIYEAEEMIIL